MKIFAIIFLCLSGCSNHLTIAKPVSKDPCIEEVDQSYVHQNDPDKVELDERCKQQKKDLKKYITK